MVAWRGASLLRGRSAFGRRAGRRGAPTGSEAVPNGEGVASGGATSLLQPKKPTDSAFTI